MRIVDAVRQIREMDPGIGYYKLWLMMKRMFLCDWVPGRDAFLHLLRDFQLMQRRPKPRHMEKPRAFDPRGQAALTPTGNI